MKHSECYCNFLYCINSWFIPRKDWLVYLSYELNEKTQNHSELMDKIYFSKLSENGLKNRSKAFKSIKNWMQTFCKKNGWVK